MKRSSIILLALLAIILLGVLINAVFLSNDKVDFNAEIRPILNNKCLRCHGGVKRQGDLSMLFREEALRGGESGNAAIIPGKPGASEVVKRIRHHDPEMRMPLEEDPLSEEEIQLIEKWISQGANWEDHWAYIAPERPEVPSASDKSWPRNEIDNFVLARLDEEDMKPSEEAEKATLIRRVNLDLTGLPPTREELQNFLEDDSPDAYEKVIDRLLDSPRFGERWASMWLDLARYADSKGYEKDPYRSIWKYRDWVIDAFNQDMPFDQFTREQIAGDLLPNPTESQLIATAFHRNTMNNTEGGTEDQEYRTAAVLDRVNTTWTVWQGTTMECVQCHSHPYDPFRQEDYYRFMAFFNNTQDADLDTEVPVLETFSPKEDSAIEEVIDWIEQKYPQADFNEELSGKEKIKKAIWPRLIAGDCDDFNDVEIHWDGSVGNWARLPKNIPDKNFYIKFSDIDLNDLETVSFLHTCSGDKGRLEIRMGAPGGVLIGETDLSTQKKYATKDIEVPSLEGLNDLYFWLINTNAKESDPDGIIRIKEITLNYKDVPPPDDELSSWQDSLLRIRRKAVQTPVMKARTEGNLRSTHLFVRGNWLAKAEEVNPGMPGSLPEIPAEKTPDRMAVAEWLVSAENPLTARVTVNRFWEQLFGRGLVETTEDFGTQGIPPTHSELLDWLAVYFANDLDWSVKQLLKTITLSATYRQSSKVTQDKLAMDKDNRLYARGPRIRLSAEQIRDQALAVSGLLSEKMYGKPVMPPQPDGIWQVVYSGEQWKTSEEEDKYRRAVYTHWRRTSPYPSMVSFDSPSREFCMPRRISTNTPLQALVTLNDPVYVEAAEALAERMKEEGGDDPASQIRKGYELALMKSPSPRAEQALLALYEDAQQMSLADNPPTETNAVGIRVVDTHSSEESENIDPMVVVANAILNLDSFIMKE